MALEKKNLEENLEKAITSHREIINHKDKEIEVLKENYGTVMKLNKQSTDCVKNLEDTLERVCRNFQMTSTFKKKKTVCGIGNNNKCV